MDLGEGPVTCVGGRTQWNVGGAVDDAAREVRAPVGIVDYEPAEMVVRVGAGTTVAALDAALLEANQMVPLDPRAATADRATVGGVLAVGHSGTRRLRYGPVRDVVLEVTLATADGKTIKAGGPVVKNVTGYDLCRLFVGSLGTLGFLVETVLRCYPRPRVSGWWQSEGADPFDVRRRLFRPSSILWNGSTTWVLLEGPEGDVREERSRLGGAWTECAAPVLPEGGRESVRPSALRQLAGEFVAEIGVGTVHRPYPVDPPRLDARVRQVHDDLKASFDPDGRLNPGRASWS